jgi:hydroxymethylbilane synthase
LSEGKAIRIGTRASELALRQAAIVRAALEAQGIASEIVKIKTSGDKNLDQPLAQIGGKGLFTRELEVALLRKKVDLCVHSLKDLPTESPDGLRIAAMLEREDPRDVLVVSELLSAEGISDLPAGTRVGTSSLRRRSQLLALRPDLEVAELRGNVPTRIRKVDDGRVHAAILAAAGIHRLGARQRIRSYLDAPAWLPAAGQGVIAVQIREADDEIATLVSGLHHEPSAIAARAERAFLEAMDGGCQVPVGALVVQRDGRLVLHGFIGDDRGTHTVRGEQIIDADGPEKAGRALALSIRSRGGEELVLRMRDMAGVPSPQPE